MKGFATLCVVLGHVVNSYYDSGLYIEISQFQYLLNSLINSFNMAFFMTISGFLYRRAYFDENNNLRKSRFKRQVLNLFGVYLMYSVLFGISRTVMAEFSVSKHSLSDVLFILIRPIGPYWYLYVLIIFYLLFILVGSKNKYTPMLLILIALLSIVSSYCPTDIFSLPRCLYYCLFFFLGMLHQQCEGKVLTYKWLPICSIIIGLLFLAIWKRSFGEINMIGEINTIPVTRTLLALGISSVLWILAFQTCLGQNKFLLIVGKNSLEIYVLHIFIVTGLKVILPRIGIINGYLSIGMNFVISASMPVILAMLLKRLEIHKYFFRPISAVKERIDAKSDAI